MYIAQPNHEPEPVDESALKAKQQAERDFQRKDAKDAFWYWLGLAALVIGMLYVMNALATSHAPSGAPEAPCTYASC